jgi:hypothetical protein
VRALLSFGIGTHAELLEIAKPSFEKFAAKHGYDLVLPENVQGDRPASWLKILLIEGLLQDGYDEVLFLGADLVIVDTTDDLDVPKWAWQALVAHQTGEGEIPNADMWLVRQPMLPYLRRIWGMVRYLNHGWWEQRALIDLMGYQSNPFRSVELNALYAHTFFLDSGWNVHIHDENKSDLPRIMHATMFPDRAAIMREWAK